MSTSVVHLKRSNFTVRIDRETPWGNPFKMRSEADRAQVIADYETWVRESDDRQARWIRDHIANLKGEILGCWCAPKPCHGDVLARLAEEES